MLHSAEDKEQFAVWIRARKGNKDDQPQKVYITPHPQLPSEFNVIEHVSKNSPDKASSFYTTFSKEEVGAAHFNRIGLEADEPVMTKKVTVAGVNLVIEENTDKGSLYNRLVEKDAKGVRANNLRQLTLCADEVVIGCELHLPGADVYIYARELRFEDAGGKIARIVTTPRPVTARQEKSALGMRGQKGGDVHLFVKSLVAPGTAHRIITRGGKGQPARHGQPGEDGTSVPVWDGKVPVEGKVFDFSGRLKDDFEKYSNKGELEKGKPVKVSVRKHITMVKDEFQFWWPSDVRPTDGKRPEREAGHPGAGGDGGSVYTRFKDQLESRVNLHPGDVGEPADDVKASAAGTPSPALEYLFVYNTAPLVGPRESSFKLANWVITKPGSAFLSPRTTGIRNKSGEILPLKSKAGESYWLHPAAARAVIAYSDDAYLAGDTKEAREMLVCYLDAAKVAAAADKGEAGWLLLQSELAALLQRIDGPYDYFGNPAGWVPLLSFQTNYQLFKSEMESAVRAMFLAYWIQYQQKRATEAADTLKAARNRLHAENEQALSNLDAAEAKLGQLASGMASIGAQIRTTWELVTDMKKTLTAQVKDDLKTEHLLRSSAKILGGVMQLIPVGQPALGSVGKALTVLGDIDTDNPKASLGKVAGAFAPVATAVGEKAKDKAEEIFAGLKQKEQLAETEKKAKAREKQEEFDKEVAKEELEKKVKEHIEKKEKAKESILAGFSGFAVSEDDVKERLEKVLADTPLYKGAISEIEKLNGQKREFNEQFVATMQAIDAATTTILNNQFTILELQAQLDAKLEQLSLEALQGVQEMGRRARERLLLYQYYLLKSYQYLMLEDERDIDFRAQKLFDKFAELLTKSKDGMLNKTQYDDLSATFTDQLKTTTSNIIAKYSSFDEKSEKSKTVTLTPAQIETLNGEAKCVEIDLLWALDDLQQEDMRITNIETDGKLVELAEPLPDKVVTLYLDYVHDGVTRVNQDGRLYLFRSGQYRVEEKSGGRLPRTDIHWGTTIEYDPETNSKTVMPTKRDEEVKWLVNELIRESGSGSGKNPMARFKPGIWTRLTVQCSSAKKAKIGSLTLRLHYISNSVNKVYSTVGVRVADDAQPFIRCDALDANGRGDGAGSFIRTFKRGQKTVTFTAPAFYGIRELRGWNLGDKFITGRSCTLKLIAPDYIVEPVYGPLTETPVNEKGEEWPACPVGWVFDDWLFVNGTTSELTISEILIGRNAIPAQVNEPQGGIRVKLSFERLKLLPGEATKLSVCLDPEGRMIAFTEFGFQNGGAQYYVTFDVKGMPSGFKKGGNLVFNVFDVDAGNRVLTFARP